VTARIEARAALYREVKGVMAKQGLSKLPRDQYFSRLVGDHATGCVHFSSATKQSTDAFWIQMSVGVEYPELEALIAEWTRTPASGTTVHVNVGNFPPTPNWWDVRVATMDDVPRALEAIASAYSDVAEPFLERCGDPLYLASLIEAGLVPRLRTVERLPVLYAHAGALAEAADAFRRYEAAAFARYSPEVRAILFSQGFRRHFGPQIGLSD
jgi:hypothetical protein